MKICKNEKGAITLFVLVSMLFLTMFLITIYTLSTNNEIAQRNVTSKLKEKYEIGLENIEDVYTQLADIRAFDENGDEIKNFDKTKYATPQYLSNHSGWSLELNYGETVNVEPYYIVCGEIEAKIKEYITTLGTEDGIVKKKIKLQNIELGSTDITTFVNSIDNESTHATEIEIKENCNTSNMDKMFYNLINLERIDLSGLNTSSVTSMSSAFMGCKKLNNITFGENFNTENVRSMDKMFNGASEITTLDLTNFRTPYLTGMQAMFFNCKKLTTLNVNFSSGNFDTSKVTDMTNLFYECNKLATLDLTNFDTSGVTNGMGGMFFRCNELAELNLDNFHTDNVRNMNNMFRDCKKLITLDISSFNTGKVTDMSIMFYGCSLLTKIDGISNNIVNPNFVTNNVTNMYVMFSGCNALAELNVSNFNTEKVKDMNMMFYYCRNLTKIIGLDNNNLNTNFVTNNVTNMYSMFNECRGLTELNLSNFDTSKVTNMKYMFYDCTHLTDLNVSSFNTSGLNLVDESEIAGTSPQQYKQDGPTYMYGIFKNCDRLTTLNLGPNFIIVTPIQIDIKSGYTKDTNGNIVGGTITQTDYIILNMFGGCSNLTTVNIENTNTYSTITGNIRVTGTSNVNIFVDTSSTV